MSAVTAVEDSGSQNGDDPKKKPFFNKGRMHFWDVTTDILYFLFVAKYNLFIWIIMAVTMTQSALATKKLIWCDQSGRCQNLCSTFKAYFFGYLHDDTEEERIKRIRKVSDLFVSQNAAMFALQMLNSFLIGNTWNLL